MQDSLSFLADLMRKDTEFSNWGRPTTRLVALILLIGGAVLAYSINAGRGGIAHCHLYERLSSETSTVQASHRFQTKIISVDPLMLYLEHFVTTTERLQLMRLCDSLYTPSLLLKNDGYSILGDGRTSWTCYLSDVDPLVIAIKARVASIAGFLPYHEIEGLQLVRYSALQKYTNHYDWFPTAAVSPDGYSYNRLASIFVYLYADCTGGETYFPRIIAPNLNNNTLWSTTDAQKGVAFIPQAGNGIFWMNLDAEDIGDRRLLHTGRPVENGTKIGMNIWLTKLINTTIDLAESVP